MPQIHPHIPLEKVYAWGAKREQDILRLLAEGLPPTYDLFHNLNWSAMLGEQQHFGEVDIVVLSPDGHVLLLEIKAGDLIEKPQQLLKNYGGYYKDVGQQIRRQHAGFLERMQEGTLAKTQIDSLLVLPDHHLNAALLAYPAERVVDASQLDGLCHRIRQFHAPAPGLTAQQRQQWIAFLSNRFDVAPDVATQVGNTQQISLHLSSGMAHWVPKIQQAQGVYVIQATAGSGKTQLALKLLQTAAQNGQRAQYVCFNRPLADHLTRLAPPQVDVTTFHQICRDHATKNKLAIDFEKEGVFAQMENLYLRDAQTTDPRWDLLILDESQDFAPEWVEALIQQVKPQGRLYVMGDDDQQLYARESFALHDAVHIACMDNYRSPRRLVQMINELALTASPVIACGANEGDWPQFHIYGPGHKNHDEALNRCLKNLWQSGYAPEQVAVLTYQGQQKSTVLQKDTLGDTPIRRFLGQYDSAGNPRWSEGALLVDSLYRFKGQSMPVVVLCEVDFETLTDKDRRKLFVGLTRAQMRVELLVSSRAVQALSQHLDVEGHPDNRST